MKKLVLLLLTVALLLFAGCAAHFPPVGTETPDATEPESITEMYITVNDHKLKITLADNSSVTALTELLKAGDITYTADDYGGFEKVGNIGHTLPKNDTQITTEAGDVMLYLGNQICIFIGSNSWAYTPIGKINGYTVSELRAILGAGEGAVEITIGLK